MAESTRVLNIPPEEIEAGKTMAFVSYLSIIVGLPLFIIPLVVEDMKKNNHVSYRASYSSVYSFPDWLGCRYNRFDSLCRSCFVFACSACLGFRNYRHYKFVWREDNSYSFIRSVRRKI